MPLTITLFQLTIADAMFNITLMQSTAQLPDLSPEEYLEGEKEAAFRHEYLDGQAYAMAGASDSHGRISGNIYTLIKGHLRSSRSHCSVFIADMKVKLRQGKAFFYPDVLVTCDPSDRKRNYYKETPVLICEVLSETTEGFDRGEKFANYRTCESITDYVLIDSRTYRVDVYHKNESGRFELMSYSDPDETVQFPGIDLSISVKDIYEDVDFNLPDDDSIA